MQQSSDTKVAKATTMYANGYVGTSEDAQRLRKLDKQREQQRKKFEELQDQKKREAAGLRQFGSSKSEAYEAAFKTETVGLVTRKEFLEKRATIQERLEEDELRERLQAEAAAAEEKQRRRKEKEKKRAKAKLSFAADVSECAVIGCMVTQRRDNVMRASPAHAQGLNNSQLLLWYVPWLPLLLQEEEEQQEEGPPPTAAAQEPVPAEAAAGTSGASGDEAPSTSGAAAEDGPAAKRPKFSKLGKDPGVATNFLPDKDRELQEEELRAQLKRVSEGLSACSSVAFQALMLLLARGCK